MADTVSLELTTASHQPRAADVVIVGGGVIGVSIAWHLMESGVRNIVVVERSDLGSGSSAKPLGGVRANFSDPSNIALGQRSLQKFSVFPEKFGVDIGFRRVGYLFLGRTEEACESMAEAVQLQNDMGVRSSMVTPEEAGQLNPLVHVQALLGASYSPDDGYARPSQVVHGYSKSAAQGGVTFLDRTQVLSIDTTAGAVSSVTTSRGEIRTPTVICCAGAWSAGIGEMAGVELPVTPVRRLIGFSAEGPTPLPTIPFTLDLQTTLYFHNSRDGLLLGISHDQEPCFCREFSYEWMEEFRAAARICAPTLSKTEILGGWAGLYENTPDRNALIGEAADVSGFFYATGFSGHGFLQAPAVGELVTDMYHGRQSFMDPSPFSIDRFTQNSSVRRETNII